MSTQVPMDLGQRPEMEVIRRQQSIGEAVRLSRQMAQLDAKEVYLALGVQKSVWSDIESGKRSFPLTGDLSTFQSFRDLVGNDVLLLWLLHAAGYDPASVRPYQSETERELERTREELAEARRELEIAARFVGRANRS